MRQKEFGVIGEYDRILTAAQNAYYGEKTLGGKVQLAAL